MENNYPIRKFHISVPEIKPSPSVDPRRVSKHFDIVLGFDFHVLRIGCFPVPCPVTPFGALIFDVMDYIHVTLPPIVPQLVKKDEQKEEGISNTKMTLGSMELGGKVKVNGFYKGAATSGLLSLPPVTPPLPKSAKAVKKLSSIHLFLPNPILFFVPFLAPHDGEVSHGSEKVLVEGMEMTGQFNNVYSCQDLGMVIPTNPTGFFNYFLTVVAVTLPIGKPVMVGGPFVRHKPSFLEIANALLMMGIMASPKLLGKLLTMINKIVAARALKSGNMKLFNRCKNIQPFICKFLGEPVDAATGRLYGAIQGFELGGPFPFVWKGKYFSDTGYRGELGMGILHSYSHTLIVDEKEGVVGLVDPDGITIPFPALKPGEEFFHPIYKWTLHKTADLNKEYYLSNKQGEKYYFTDWEDTEGWRHLRKITDRNGFNICFEYDMMHLLVSATDCVGRKICFTNDSNGCITSISVPSATGESYQTMVSYVYDDQGRMISFMDSTGIGQTLIWGSDNRLAARSFKSGEEFVFSYDKEGRCVAAEGPEGKFSYYFDYQPGVTVVTDSLDVQKRYYHRDGIVTKEVDSREGETIYHYDSCQNLLSKEGPDGKAKIYTYDDRGNLVCAQIPGNGTTKIDYNHLDLPIAVKLPGGAEWRYEYDERGNLIRQVNPNNRQSNYLWTEGLLKKIQDSVSGDTELFYDRNKSLNEILYPNETSEYWVRDMHGKVLSYCNVKGAKTFYTYDAADRLIEARLPDGNIRSYEYNANGNLWLAKDCDGGIQLYYDLFGNITDRIEGGKSLHFMYDTEGRLMRVVNEAYENYDFIRDGEGDIIEEIGFDGIKRAYNRDHTGLVRDMVLNGKYTTGYEYDEAGRITDILRYDGKHEEYSYDTSGRLIKAVNDDAIVEMEYDCLGHIIKETCNGEEVCSHYNQLGLRESVVSGMGADIHAEYNPMGDLLSMVAGSWSCEYHRDEMGLETEQLLPGNIRKLLNRDVIGRVKEQKIEKKHSLVDEKEYIWGTNDRLLSVIINGEHRRYEYDNRGFLVKTFFEDGSEQLRIPDDVGNLYESISRKDRSYGSGGRLERQGKWKYRYDDCGNLIKKSQFLGETWKYEWNSGGMLEKVIRPDKQKVTFKYDALGRRIEKAFGNILTKWLWDGNVPLHEWKEYHIHDYKKDRGEFVRVEKQAAITWIFEEGTFVPVAKLTANGNQSIVTNYMGTPEAMYNSSGEQIWSCDLDSYGRVRKHSGNLCDCPWRYQGQFEDEETGLYYNRFRYFDSSTGNFLSQDPIGLLSGCLAFYSYVKDSNKFIDVFGLYNGEGERELGVYDSYHTHVLDAPEYTKSDPYHFAKANESLHQRFQNDPQFAAAMEAKYPGIIDHVSPGVRGGFSSEAPPGTTWHHADTPGNLDLVDRVDHKKYHKIYHPDDEGGRKKWGGGIECR